MYLLTINQNIKWSISIYWLTVKSLFLSLTYSLLLTQVIKSVLSDCVFVCIFLLLLFRLNQLTYVIIFMYYHDIRKTKGKEGEPKHFEVAFYLGKSVGQWILDQLSFVTTIHCCDWFKKLLSLTCISDSYHSNCTISIHKMININCNTFLDETETAIVRSVLDLVMRVPIWLQCIFTPHVTYVTCRV